MLESISRNFFDACSETTGIEEQIIEKIANKIFADLKDPIFVAEFLGAVVVTVGFFAFGKPFLEATILRNFAR